ncbi:endocuticle structural protein SgAbd-6-like [Drosophila innubila]|uniref:endocuticle structural protein SgAbd-6-like n=1 Tax=Drosophila innubila TaxID=198719 RepID=UPI00148B7E31|nr:endocuticle structural protein SgAbd-6-like [Drosophila innubila]
MKSVLIFFCLCIALGLSAPPGKEEVHIVEQSADVQANGYKLSLETSDGTKRSEDATVKNPGTDDEALSVKGLYSYVGNDGVTYTVNFIADENGYQPQGAHLPHV